MTGDAKLEIPDVYHEEGFFSTEPSWLDYAGTSTGNFNVG